MYLVSNNGFDEFYFFLFFFFKTSSSAQFFINIPKIYYSYHTTCFSTLKCLLSKYFLYNVCVILFNYAYLAISQQAKRKHFFFFSFFLFFFHFIFQFFQVPTYLYIVFDFCASDGFVLSIRFSTINIKKNIWN